MKVQPSYYNSDLVGTQLSLETRSDKLGNIFHYVCYVDNNDVKQYARFTQMSSALDFINSNFR